MDTSTMVMMATGTGKTVVMCEAARLFPKHLGRIMMIAHREELVNQAAEKFRRSCGDVVGIEMGDQCLNESLPLQLKPRIVVASIDTLNAGRSEPRYLKFDPMEFGFIMDDECHHCPAPSRRRLHGHFKQNPKCKFLGVTATPDRADEKSLGACYQSVAFEYDILTAIDEGYLVPIQQQFVQVDGLDLSKCDSNKRDLLDDDVAEVMRKSENLYAVADSTRRIANGRKTLIFTASVQHAHDVADILCGYEPDSAIAIDGKTDKSIRPHQLKRFARGEFKYLVNCGVFLEGYDEPTIEVVSMARPTKSRALYSQAIGRGTRPLYGVIENLNDPVARRSAIACCPKPHLTVLDFVGNSGQHKLICTADILGGEEPDEVLEWATKAAKNRGGAPVDMRDEIEEARKEIEADRQRKTMRITPKANFRTSMVDPFSILDVTVRREPGWFKGKRPTEPMRNALVKMGIDQQTVAKASFFEAKVLLDKMSQRRKQNLSSFKQMRLLQKNGIDATGMTFAEASARIDKIAKQQGWGQR